jgi:hypothetical protein
VIMLCLFVGYCCAWHVKVFFYGLACSWLLHVVHFLDGFMFLINKRLEIKFEINPRLCHCVVLDPFP